MNYNNVVGYYRIERKKKHNHQKRNIIVFNIQGGEKKKKIFRME